MDLSVEVQAALIGGVVGASVGGLLQLASTWMTNRSSVNLQQRDARIVFRRDQLNLFYRPIYLRRRESENLRAMLPSEIEGERWRLVDHIADAKSDPEVRPIVEELLECGDAIQSLILSNGAYIEGVSPPECFEDFIHHHRMLRMSWAAGSDQDPTRRFPFPGGDPRRSIEERCQDRNSIDTDIDCAIHFGTLHVAQKLSDLLAMDS